MSQIDIAPTLLGALDFSYYTKFLGRDVLHSPPATDRAFVANYQTLGYLRGEDVVLLEPRRKVEVFRRRGDALVPLRNPDPSLVREAIAFYQVASHAFRNGLYLDEEQIPPNDRANAQDPRGPPQPVSSYRPIAPAAPAGS